jgi:cytochrome c oxidase subunit 2
MQDEFKLFPDQASTLASQIDWLYAFLVAVSLFFSVLIFVLVGYFAIRYRRGTKADRSNPVHGHHALELAWTIIPLALAMVMFFWGASLFIKAQRTPDGAFEIYVLGKQWMWKMAHPSGRREINELHVPIGRPIKLTMTSEDVIHSFFVPAFRMKMDVIPGRYTTAWFEATMLGEFRLFCSEYCGTNHSKMGGKVVVMPQADYERWLTGGASSEPPEILGERLFQKLACVTCHRADGGGRGPSLNGVFGTQVALQSGRSVLANEDYVRESILDPKAKLVKGWDPVMPTFSGQLGEEGVIQLIAYLKSIGKKRQ